MTRNQMISSKVIRTLMISRTDRRDRKMTGPLVPAVRKLLPHKVYRPEMTQMLCYG